MKSIQLLRERFLGLLEIGFKAPGMFGGESVLHDWMGHLAFIDDLEVKLDQEIKQLEALSIRLSTGIRGGFAFATGIQERFEKEAASVLAEVAYRLIYLNIERTLPTNEFARLRNGIRKRCGSRDWTLEEVAEEYGPASWSIGSNPLWSCVFCYASADIDEKWVFFDFWNELEFSKDQRVFGKYGPTPMLRNVRVPASTFKRFFTFTPFGRLLRGGSAPSLAGQRGESY